MKHFSLWSIAFFFTLHISVVLSVPVRLQDQAASKHQHINNERSNGGGKKTTSAIGYNLTPEQWQNLHQHFEQRIQDVAPAPFPAQQIQRHYLENDLRWTDQPFPRLRKDIRYDPPTHVSTNAQVPFIKTLNHPLEGRIVIQDGISPQKIHDHWNSKPMQAIDDSSFLTLANPSSLQQGFNFRQKQTRPPQSNSRKHRSRQQLKREGKRPVEVFLQPILGHGMPITPSKYSHNGSNLFQDQSHNSRGHLALQDPERAREFKFLPLVGETSKEKASVRSPLSVDLSLRIGSSSIDSHAGYFDTAPDLSLRLATYPSESHQLYHEEERGTNLFLGFGPNPSNDSGYSR